jgi:hypothetical protein
MITPRVGILRVRGNRRIHRSKYHRILPKNYF